MITKQRCSYKIETFFFVNLEMDSLAGIFFAFCVNITKENDYKVELLTVTQLSAID